jgi:hypothetical protein
MTGAFRVQAFALFLFCIFASCDVPITSSAMLRECFTKPDNKARHNWKYPAGK